MASYNTPPPNCKLDLKPFKAEISQQAVDELRQLVRLSPLGPQTYENSHEDHRMGVSYEWMSAAKKAWETTYDWRACEAKVNSFPNFTASLTDPENPSDVHSIHFLALFSTSPTAVPITLLHGWPGSFLEFLGILELLRKKYPDPSKLPYHVIVPSLPGWCYSSKVPLGHDFDISDLARIVNTLMEGLGFGESGYVAQGGDVGSFACRELAGRFKSCRAIHVNMNIMWNEPPDIAEGEVTAEEKTGLERKTAFFETGRGYAIEHATRPATIGFALSSSPLAVLAWIGEKFVEWSDTTPPLTEILDSVSLYWLTQTSARAIYTYRGNVAARRNMLDKNSITHIADKPIGYSWFPKELGPAPVAWVKRTGNLAWWKRHDGGGHFAALEKPAELLVDIEEFVAQVWDGAKL